LIMLRGALTIPKMLIYGPQRRTSSNCMNLLPWKCPALRDNIGPSSLCQIMVPPCSAESCMKGTVFAILGCLGGAQHRRPPFPQTNSVSTYSFWHKNVLCVKSGQRQVCCFLLITSAYLLSWLPRFLVPFLNPLVFATVLSINLSWNTPFSTLNSCQ